jgi:hypothetical protein
MNSMQRPSPMSRLQCDNTSRHFNRVCWLVNIDCDWYGCILPNCDEAVTATAAPARSRSIAVCVPRRHSGVRGVFRHILHERTDRRRCHTSLCRPLSPAGRPTCRRRSGLSSLYFFRPSVRSQFPTCSVVMITSCVGQQSIIAPSCCCCCGGGCRCIASIRGYGSFSISPARCTRGILSPFTKHREPSCCTHGAPVPLLRGLL